MTAKDKLKDLLAKVKAAFADMPPAPAAPADINAPGSTVVYKTTDGTEITVTLKDPTVSVEPSVGDMVTIAGAPAPAGSLTLEDGSVFTVDATGAITAIVTPDAGAQTDLGKNNPPPAPTPAPATPVAPVTKPTGMATDAPLPTATPKTPEEIKSLYDKFATGTPEERLANLEIIAKALMEYNFGYEIRKGQENAAIAIYKQDLANAQAVATQAVTAMAKQDMKLKGLFDLVEQLAETPTADPATLTGIKKDKFDRAQSKEVKLQKIADAVKAMREEKTK